MPWRISFPYHADAPERGADQVEAVISARDVDSIYKVPLYFRAEGVDDQILEHFKIEAEPPDRSTALNSRPTVSSKWPTR